ncbi:unconventional myosin-IXa-like isoform X20 [Lineus longissimus]|uniref:unconventional myosin-IXa-like isoform X20 n=1 Tax=Lineus longissimus TaxID=88925 RepID=UPI00315DB02D
MLRYPHSQMAEKVLKNGGMHRRISMETYMVRVYTGPLSQEMEFVSVEAEKETSAHRIVLSAAEKLRILYPQQYELGEVFCSSGQLCKERRIQPTEHPVRIQLLWPKHIVQNMDKQTTEYRFYLRKKDTELITEPNPIDSFLTLFQSRSNKEYPDLCNLPELNEKTLLANLKSRFKDENIYTYVGSILIAVNPFKFFPIYNPKFVKNYQNRRLGELPPHIFAIADAAFNSMLREKRNQCIVISGESGSGKTESTNLLLHHLTAISQKGLHGSGVEQTILGAGPVLEAFGNAKTVHNNNSSRFGKFIQVNYRENGMVHGAIVEKYLLEKSRIVFQAPNERNYHVFYYLLAGASEQEKTTFHLTEPQDFTYLKQSNCYTLEGVDGEFVDEAHEFERLKQSMEMVGFSTETQRRLFSVLSAVLHIGNVQFKKKSDHYHHEAVDIKNEEILAVISSLLKVKEATLKEALTKKKTVAGGETLLISYKMEEAISTRDAMAKCLYGALFDWIVLQVNHALISKKDSREHQGCSIGVLDIFGFEDFAKNSFEQFCINYANEHLQFYFNQHIFKFEQEEYIKEGIQWKSIEFLDNTSCLKLFSIGLFPLIDEACKLGATTNQDLLDNFHKMHKNSPDYEAPSVKESAFTIVHYAGRVKYRIQDFKEKNMDLMRDDIVMVLKNSSLAFVRELVGVDPVAILRWAIVRAFFRCYFAFVDAGKRYRETKGKSGHGQAAKKSTWLRPQENVQVAEDGTLSPESENLSKEGGIRLDGNRPNITSHEDGSPSSPQDSRMTPKPIDGYQNQGNKENMIRNEIAKLTKMKLKNKSFKPKTRPHKGRRDLKSLKSVAGRQFSMKQGSSVGSQFQSSLTLLMQTLDQANPFFIRCIKSNADKTPCVFDEEIILRQLRYTGMLATVEIRRLGYNYRLAFDEFIHHYKILLPNGLLSSKQDVSAFLSKNITTDDYQIGATKVFLREPEKMELDQALHHAIMERVIKIQRWMRTTLERKKYVQMKKASVMIQSHVRTFIARRRLYRKLFVAISIQKWYRGFKIRRNYLRMVKATIVIQKHYRGYTARQRFKVLLAQDREQRRLKLEEEKEKEKQPQPSVSHLKQDLGDVHSSTSDEGMFTKESSTEELEIDKDFESTHTNDSEESSGILDDSESEAGKHLPPFSTPPLTPVSPKAPPSILTSTVKMRPAISASGEAIGEESLASPVWRPRVRQMVDSIEKPDVSEKHKVPRVTVDSPPKKCTHQTSHFFIRYVRRQSAYAKSSGLEPLDLFKQDVVDKRALQNYVTARPLSATIERGPLLSPNSYQAAKRFDDVEEEDRAKTRTLPITKNSKFAAELANDLQKRKTLSPKPKPTESGHKQGGFAKKIKDIVGDIADTKATAARSSLVKHLSVRCKKLSDKLHHGETYHWKKARDDDEYQMEEGLKKTFIDSIGVHVLPNKPGNKISSPTKTPEIEKELLPPEDSEKRKLRRGRRNSRHRREDVKVEPPSTYVVTGRSQWQYPSDLYVKDQRELKDLDQFIFSKLVRMSEDCGQNDSMTERIFKKALKEFHSTLIGSQSLAMKDSNNYKLRYRDLMLSFEQILHCKIEAEDTANNAIEFPSTMVINAFRGFLDEFEKKQRDQGERRAPDKKRNDKKGKKEKDKVIWEHLGHKFMLQQFNIPTFCEYCNSLTWWRDKIYNCQTCKFTCHPKCVSKCTTLCRGQSEEHGSSSSGKVFGAPLSHLILDGMTIPTIFDDMINAIEANGLYTEGLYRKSGVQGKVRQLVKACNENYEIIDFNEYPVHVLATTFKTFLRELPEPLLTFDLFDEFLRGAEISTERERIQSIYSVIEKLPRYNHDMLERLMFHLARVARSEDVNKMSSNGLAIIFAPCILKTNRDLSAQEILSNVPKQTLCVECIILEQLKKLNVTLENISELEDEAASFQIRLESIRDSRKSSKGSRSPGSPQHTLRRVATEVDEENFQMIYREVEREIEGELQSLERKREELTSSLAMLECRNASSDEDMLSAEDIDDDDYATSDYQDAFESPVTPSMNEPAFPITPRFGHNTKDNNGNSHNIETSRRTNSEPSQPRAPLPRFGGFDPSQETPKSRFQKSSSLDQKDNTEQPQTRSQLKLNTVSKDSPKNEASPNDNSPDAAQSKFRFPKFGKAKENKEEVTPKIKLPKFGVSSRDTRDDSSVDVKSKGDFQHSGKFRLRRIGNPKKFRHSFSNDESREQEVTESDTGSSITMSTDSIRSDENYYVQMETGEDDIDEIMV